MSRQELADAMRMLGLNPKEEEIQYILNTIDIEGNDYLATSWHMPACNFVPAMLCK